MLKSLQGIKPARDIQERAASALEKLLKEEENMRKEYAGRVDGDWGKNHNNIYLPLYRSLFSTLPDYTEQDLQSVLLTKANNSYRDNEAQVLGMYTGVLLHVLTERAEKEKRAVAFTFDLSGNEFDYLFYFAKRAGKVTVKNVKGRGTCQYLASYGGKAEKVVLEGNEGDEAAYGAGSFNGNVEILIIKDNEGDYAASRAGKNGGYVGTLVIKDNEGKCAASWAGNYGGKVGILIIHGNEGDLVAYEAGSNGNVETLIIKDNEGDYAAYLAGSYGGKVGTLVIHRNERGGAAYGVGSKNGSVGTLALYEAGRDAGSGATANRILTGEEALALYQQLEKELPCLTA